MKIGIMSMQRIINYGSFLQAYALKSIIEELGHEVVFVDYKVEAPLISDPTLMKNVNQGNAIFLLKYYAKKRLGKPLDTSYVHKMALRKLGVTETMHYNTPVDALVIGSDEVFNCLQANPDVGYSLELFGKDNRAKRLISYAASFGQTTEIGLKSFEKYDEVKSLINKFDAISVRDSNSMKIVKDMGVEEPSLNLDPVLIYDFSKKLIENHDIKNYVLVYSYANRINSEDEIEAIQAFAHKHNKKTLSVGNYQDWTDLKVLGDPLELLGYFKNADYVVTDTFHGTVFSAITGRKFATIMRDSNNRKLTTLLEMLHLEKRNLTDLDDLDDVITAPIDYETTDHIRRMEKKKAIDYLVTNLI